MTTRRFFCLVALLALWYCLFWNTTSQGLIGKGLDRPSPHVRSHLACRVIGGIGGRSFENEGCMMRELKRLATEQEELAQTAGLVLCPELDKMKTSNDFVKFADKQGADVKKKSTSYWKVSKGNVWWVLSTSRQKFRHKDVKNLVITAFKAMGIAFAKK